jgi:hypothetical protein
VCISCGGGSENRRWIQGYDRYKWHNKYEGYEVGNGANEMADGRRGTGSSQDIWRAYM